ncbi:protein OXIDATIVE STRESS 3-like [Syzygium oleosum]|uniref:protein OXIDATIVE STRESS 3-like n=1 Tax=Syzygium oleosum TaxID=219896 RepID=UPI0011D24737|nr:protein OXIDATIVE STRESS 3-like [Syzygium oleosum]
MTLMGGEDQSFGDLGLRFLGDRPREEGWSIMEGGGGCGGGDNVCDDSESVETSMDDQGSRDSSRESSSSSSSSSPDLLEDASSSPSPSLSKSSLCSSSSSSSSSLAGKHGPLYELSDLMAQLPIKRGLSRYYDGKSQSFTSLASCRSVEDLVKKERPYVKRLKLCKSYAGGLDSPNRSFGPKAIISKKGSSSRSAFPSSSSSSSHLGKRCTSLSNRPPVPILKTF